MGAGVVEGVAVVSGAAVSLRLAVVLEAAGKRSGIVVPSLKMSKKSAHDEITCYTS